MYFILTWTFLLAFTTSIAAPVDERISPLPPKVYLQLLKSLPQPVPSLSTASREQATLANLWKLSERVSLPKHHITDILKHIKERDEVRKRNRWIQSSERHINNTVDLFISQAWLNRKENRAEPNDINISIRHQGLTFDFCSSDSDCQGTRTCQEIDAGLICRPSELQFCTSDSDCVSGEFCLDSDESDDFCASTTAFQKDPSSSSSSGDTSGSGSSSQGLTLDSCSSDSDCQDSRTCQESDQSGLICVPSEFQICTSDSDCVSGEFCFDPAQSDDFCASTTVGHGDPSSSSSSGGTDEEGSATAGTDEDGSTTASTDEEGSTTAGQGGTQSPPADGNNSGGGPGNVPNQGNEQGNQSTSEPCIAVHSLQHLSHRQLVFRENLLANVLCDENHSCATPGHMVTYSGSGMMMKSYCELIGGCTRKVMFVNSPIYERGTMVASKSDGMLFTAFSARYETTAEERMLSFAIRVGL